MNDSFPALDLSAAAAPRPPLPALRRPPSGRPVPALKRTRRLVLVLGGLAGLTGGAMPPRLWASAPPAGAPAVGAPAVGAPAAGMPPAGAPAVGAGTAAKVSRADP